MSYSVSRSINPATLDFPAPPAGTSWTITEADWLDDGHFLRFPLKSTLAVRVGGANAWARPNMRSLRRAARRALRNYYAAQRQSAVWRAKTARQNKKTTATIERLVSVGSTPEGQKDA